MSRRKVVVVGSGFAGLNAARGLRGTEVDISVIDRRNFHLFQPLLYQVAAAALNPSDIAYPLRSIFRKQANVVDIVLAEVSDVDLENRQLQLSDETIVEFDYLILATGASHSYFGNEEWAAHAPGLKTIEDALAIRGRILTAFERAEKDPALREKHLTFVVVGAGPTGVELAGAIKEIAGHGVDGEFDHIDPTSARVILVEGSSRVLPMYPASLSKSAQDQLQGLGVEVETESLVASIDADGVVLQSGERINASTVLWAAGVRASAIGAMLGAELDSAGRVLVGPDLSLPGYPDVFVAGDLARVEGVPGVAPAAMQMGRHVAWVIDSDIGGGQRPHFKYVDKGSLATIGRARAVADIRGFRFSGVLAWAAWLGIHIFYLIGFRNRLFVLASWAWSYLTFKRGAKIITGAPGTKPS